MKVDSSKVGDTEAVQDFDLADLDTKKTSEEGRILKLRHPSTKEILTHGGKEFSIVLRGSDSDEYNRVFKKNMRKQMQLAKKNGNVVDADVSESATTDMLVSMTVGWSGIYLNGAELQFSKEAAAKLYTDYRWIREQVDAFIHDRSNFIKV